MRNTYEVRANYTVIFLQRKDGSQMEARISNSKLEKVLAIDGKFYPMWHKRKQTFYARCDLKISVSRVKCTMLHRVIKEPGTGQHTTHLDGDGLNCVDSNLMNVAPFIKTKDAIQQAIPAKRPTSGTKGVTWHVATSRWASTVFYQGKRYCLGYSKTEAEAVKIVMDFRKEKGIK